MYIPDNKDTLEELKVLPKSSIGAPCPLVMTDEHKTFLAYILQDQSPNWDGTSVRVIDSDSVCSITIVECVRRYAMMFGPPNDEAFDGHPLCSRGLRPYAAFEVRNSSWIRALEQMNRVHDCHDPKLFLSTKRHFILAFHDSTFECVARDIRVVEVFQGTMKMAASKLKELIEQ